MATDIFISYSRKDYDQVRRVKEFLDKELGINCWMDMDGIESGEQFKDVIISAINRHDIVLFMMTKSSMNSPWALKELNFAEKKKKRIILVDLDHSPMTDAFEFDYGNKDNIDWSLLMQREKLIKNLKQWLNKNPTPTSTLGIIESDNANKIIPEHHLASMKEVEIGIPDKYSTPFLIDFEKRHGFIMSMSEDPEGFLNFRAMMPLSEMHDYDNILRDITYGRGHFSMKFDHSE